MFRRILIGVGVCLIAGTLLLQAAPTPAEVKAATAKGVAWLAAQQGAAGCWSCGNTEEVAITAFAILKLEHHAVDPKYGLGLPSPFDPAYAYKAHVEKGLLWLLQRGVSIPIGAQPAGNPDTNGNGISLAYGWEHHRNYSTAAVLMAVCQSVELNRLVSGGPANGWTYKQAAEDMMNYLAWGQQDADKGPGRGGWYYYGNYPAAAADNSNSGYVSVALGYAAASASEKKGCGLPIPAFVKTELNFWIDYIQNDVNGDPSDGGSGYNSPDSWVNTLKTGNLLQQMALYGDIVTTQRVKDALAYLQRHWNDPNWDPGWKGAGNSEYQATFTIMKGMTAFGLEKFGMPEIDWQADFDTALLAQQFADGSFPSTIWDVSMNRQLSTIWALLTLERAAPIVSMPVPVDIKPGSCPNPINVGSKGVLPVAIAGTATLNVTQIDPASIKLVGVAPLHWSYEDVTTPYDPFIGKVGQFACNTFGGDGFADLSLKFDSEAISAALAPPPADREVRALPLTGKLKPEFGGKPINGEDVVILLVKK